MLGDVESNLLPDGGALEKDFIFGALFPDVCSSTSGMKGLESAFPTLQNIRNGTGLR